MAEAGTGLTELATVQSIVPIAVSPDGGELVAQETYGLYAHYVGSGVVAQIAPSGASPTFSPDGKRVAYLAPGVSFAGLAVANADGSAAMVHRGRPFLMPPAWLADSKWIITGDTEGTVLVNASTGEILPLPGLTNFRMISTSP